MAEKSDLEKFQGFYYTASAAASQNARTLALGGLAFIWLFKPSKGGIEALPGMLYISGLLFVVVLALDVLHYNYKAAAWGIFSRLVEKRIQSSGALVKDAGPIVAPDAINWPTLVLFWGKQIVLMGAYVVLGSYILLVKFYAKCILL